MGRVCRELRKMLIRLLNGTFSAAVLYCLLYGWGGPIVECTGGKMKVLVLISMWQMLKLFIV